MAVPGTGSTNQSMTLSAFKKLAGKANTSALKEFYEETIPSNVQLKTDVIFGESIPQTVIANTSSLYTQFSASNSDPVTVEYVEFYLESINGTTYDADTGTFGDVGFGGGDETQSSGPHAYQLRLTSSYQTLSSHSAKGTGFFVNDQIIHQSNGALQLVHPSFGPQTGNNYGLSLFTAHPVSGSGDQIVPTDPIDWQIDYFNGIVFIQDYNASKIPSYARGFIYIGKYANTMISEASSSGGGGGSNITVKDEGSNLSTAATSFDFVGAGVTATNPSDENITVTIPGGISYSRTAITANATASASDRILGVSASAALEIRLAAASGFSSGQFFTIKDEAGNANTNNITILTTGADTIDGQTSIVMESPHAAVNIYSDGSSKFFIY
jgi:hypothetical protein